MKPLDGKVAVVTDGSRRLDRGIVRALADDGASVIALLTEPAYRHGNAFGLSGWGLTALNRRRRGYRIKR